MERKIPIRKCIVTGQQTGKRELLRIVRTPEKEVKIDPTGKQNGRGAYILKDTSVIPLLRKKKALERHLKVEIDEIFYTELEQFLKDE